MEKQDEAAKRAAHHEKMMENYRKLARVLDWSEAIRIANKSEPKELRVN